MWSLILRRLFTQERVNAFIMALILIGVVLIAMGAYQFLDAAQKLQSNTAHQILNAEATAEAQSLDAAQGLVASDMERRRLDRQHDQSLIMAGAGLALLAVGWLGYDYVRGRRKANATPAAS